MSTTPPQEILPVVYRDPWLIAIHKPAGLLVHRSEIDRHETRFAVQILRDQIGQRVWPAHRLDRGTSGVLIFALDPTTAGALGRQFESQSVDKHYVAVVRGHPPEVGRIDHALARKLDARAWRDPRSTAEAAQAAVTDFRRLATVELPIPVDRYPTSRYALLSLTPQTGRQHQIRRHLKHIAHPIIGDATYGKGRHNRMFAERLDSARLLLACTRLGLTHPVSGEPLVIEAPLAPEFEALLSRLGWTSTLQSCSGNE